MKIFTASQTVQAGFLLFLLYLFIVLQKYKK